MRVVASARAPSPRPSPPWGEGAKVDESQNAPLHNGEREPAMLIARQGDLLVISDPPRASRNRWLFALFSLTGAGLTQIGPHAGSTTSLVFAALFGVFALVGALSPARRTEIDKKLRQVRFYNGWLWRWSRPRVIDFDDVTGVDVHLSRGSEGPDLHSPRLLLKSGQPKPLSSNGSAMDAENVARAIRHAIFGVS